MSWSKKYKKSIDCSNPKGFSQKAHCDGRKARQRGEKTKSKSVSELKMKKVKIKEVIKELLKNGWEINEEEGTIKNPETGRTIKIKTALSYDPSHPAYKLAKKQAGDTGEEETQSGEYDTSGETDYFPNYEELPDNVSKLYKKYFWDENEYDYSDLENIKTKFEKQGWTFDYDMDAVPFGLKPLNKSGIPDEEPTSDTDSNDADVSIDYDEYDNSITFGDGEKVNVDYDGDFQYKGEWFNVNDYEDEEELKQAIADKTRSIQDNKITRSQLEQMIKEELQKQSEKKLNLEQILLEGVDDPGILKCIFMAGGPGSGKSYTAMEIFGVDKKLKLSFSASGLKMVNSDKAFEAGLKKNGIDSKKLAQIEKEDPELWDKIAGSGAHSIRSKAKALTQKQRSFYESGRLGMVIDGTGHDYGKIKKQKDKAEALGYDCYMVFVNTSLEVAKERNENRDRVLPEKILVQSWKDVQNNLGKFQGLFGGNFVIVDNTVYKPIDKQIQKQVNRFVAKPIYNRIGKKWIETARALKKAKLIKENKKALKEKIRLFFEENVPTKPDKWSYAISQAKKKFDVYPSAYANAWASKKYKELGGGWRKKK